MFDLTENRTNNNIFSIFGQSKEKIDNNILKEDLTYKIKEIERLNSQISDQNLMFQEEKEKLKKEKEEEMNNYEEKMKESEKKYQNEREQMINIIEQLRNEIKIKNEKEKENIFEEQFHLLNIPKLDKNLLKKINRLEQERNLLIKKLLRKGNELNEDFNLNCSIDENLDFNQFKEIILIFQRLFILYLKNHIKSNEVSVYFFEDESFPYSKSIEKFSNVYDLSFEILQHLEKKYYKKVITKKKISKKEMNFIEHLEFFERKDLFPLFLNHLKNFTEDFRELEQFYSIIQNIIENELEIEKLEVKYSNGTKSNYLKNLSNEWNHMLNRSLNFKTKVQFINEEKNENLNEINVQNTSLKNQTNEMNELTKKIEIYEKKCFDLFINLHFELQKFDNFESFSLEQDDFFSQIEKFSNYFLKIIKNLEKRMNPTKQSEHQLKEFYEKRINYLLEIIESCDLKGVEYRNQWQKAVSELEDSYLREKQLTNQLNQLRENHQSSINEFHDVSKNYQNQIAVLSLKLTEKQNKF